MDPFNDPFTGALYYRSPLRNASKEQFIDPLKEPFTLM